MVDDSQNPRVDSIDERNEYLVRKADPPQFFWDRNRVQVWFLRCFMAFGILCVLTAIVQAGDKRVEDVSFKLFAVGCCAVVLASLGMAFRAWVQPVAPKRNDPDRPEKLQSLTKVFESLGAKDAEIRATTQIDAYSDCLGRFVFLQQAWDNIIDDQDPMPWFEMVEQYAREFPDGFWGQLGAQIDSLVAAGIQKQQLTGLVQLLQYDMLNCICCQLDEGGVLSPSNVYDNELWPTVRWQLNRVDKQGNPIGQIDRLYACCENEPSHGRQSGFRVSDTSNSQD